MPTQKSRLTKAEDQQHRARLLRLEKMGISIGYAGDPSPEPDRFILEQIWHDSARVYELPWDAVAVVAPAKLTVLRSGTLITDVAMMLPWDDWPLDLSGPEENYYYQDLIACLPYPAPTVINRLLTPEVPLRPRQVEGVIIAHGFSSVPPERHDESLVAVKLLLRDERRDEFCFKFGVRVDRSLKRKYERQQRKRRMSAPLNRGGLYGPRAGTFGDQETGSEEATNLRRGGGKQNAELQKPS